MQPGALVRKHIIDVAILCTLLCISFFSASNLYPDNYVEDPGGKWYAYSYFWVQQSNIQAYGITQIMPSGYSDYDSAQTNSIVTSELLT
jgi:hypothetical protein